MDGGTDGKATVTRVEVEPDGDDGGLVVRWELSHPAPVAIAVGPSPEAVDHVPRTGAAAGQRTLRITGLPAGRHYVSVAPLGGGPSVVAAERRLPFEGVVNFRDLGGYPTARGGRTRWGRVFRSDALHRFTALDLAVFDELGIRTVLDLRWDDERSRAPNPVPSEQIIITGRGEGAAPPAYRGRREAREGEQLLHESYVGMLRHSGPRFGRLLSRLARSEGLPAVIHCAGGKDRTGMSAALLLTWLGVDRETVLDDYVLTSRFRTAEDEPEFYDRLLAEGMAPEAALAAMGTSRWAMADALAVLDGEYGGVEAYLRGQAGMAAEVLDRLRSELVV